jgi:hypothetical protein
MEMAHPYQVFTYAMSLRGHATSYVSEPGFRHYPAHDARTQIFHHPRLVASLECCQRTLKAFQALPIVRPSSIAHLCLVGVCL